MSHFVIQYTELSQCRGSTERPLNEAIIRGTFDLPPVLSPCLVSYTLQFGYAIVAATLELTDGYSAALDLLDDRYEALEERVLAVNAVDLGDNVLG